MYRLSQRTCQWSSVYWKGKLILQRDFKDAELYLIRYQQCMTRSMTLIKIYFVNTIRATGQEVAKRLYDKVSLIERGRMIHITPIRCRSPPTLDPAPFPLINFLTNQSLSETATQALLFPKFSSLSTSLRPLILELESRTTRANDELAPLLAECHSAWISSRLGLMSPKVAEEVGRLDPTKGELVDLVCPPSAVRRAVYTDPGRLGRDVGI